MSKVLPSLEKASLTGAGVSASKHLFVLFVIETSAALLSHKN